MNNARLKAGIEPWSIDDAAATYNLRGWGKGFFEIGKNGHVLVRPTRTPGKEIDLFEVVEGLRERGLRTPVLLHFSDLLHLRLRHLVSLPALCHASVCVFARRSPRRFEV